MRHIQGEDMPVEMSLTQVIPDESRVAPRSATSQASPDHPAQDRRDVEQTALAVTLRQDIGTICTEVLLCVHFSATSKLQAERLGVFARQIQQMYDHYVEKSESLNQKHRRQVDEEMRAKRVSRTGGVLKSICSFLSGVANIVIGTAMCLTGGGTILGGLMIAAGLSAACSALAATVEQIRNEDAGKAQHALSACLAIQGAVSVFSIAGRIGMAMLILINSTCNSTCEIVAADCKEKANVAVSERDFIEFDLERLRSVKTQDQAEMSELRQLLASALADLIQCVDSIMRSTASVALMDTP
jgi:hypothetical protein